MVGLMSTPSLKTRVKKALTAIQPLLGLHGGGIELVNITTDNVVELRFDGACIGCAAANYTLEHGLKEMLMVQIEEIEDVVAVNDEPVTHQAPGILFS